VAAVIVGDTPVEGFYKTRLTKGATWVAVRIFFGRPVIDDEEQDRAPRWLVEADGKTTYRETGDDGYSCTVLLPVERYWPHCARHPISEADYRHMTDLAAWAKTHAKDRPQANPRKKIDVRGKSVF
jgi:hypothetical protein